MTLVDVSPRLMPNDGADLRRGHSEPSRNGDARDSGFPCGANHQDVCCCQLSNAASFASGGPALLNHVFGIVSTGSKEQMVRADAQRIVAVVTDLHCVVSNWSVAQFVRYARGVLSRSVNPEFTVAVRSNTAAPRPASICLFDALPEAARRIDALGCVGAGARAVRANLRYVVGHSLPALGARLRNFLRSNACARTVVAVRAAVRRDLAWSSQFHLAADGAHAFNARCVVLAEPLVALREWHIR